MEIFKLLGTIAITNDGANKAIEETTSLGEKAKTKLSTAFTKIGTAATAAGKVMAAGIGAGASAMAALTGKALGLSGELEQNMGGSEAVFAEYAQSMQDKATEAFEKMGLSASDYLATANKMGALFKGAGFDIAEASELSAQAMQRAADVASIMGISTESAMESVAGAAKGNFTMMDNLGVAMNETNLEAYALSIGIKKAYSEMTQQEKIGLAMEMFLDKTAYATGNYAKENQTLAGSLGTAKAALTNFLSGAGTVDQLVSSFVNAGEVIISNINTLLPRLVEGINQLITQLLPYIPELLNSLLPGVIEGAVALVTGLIVALPDILQLLLEQVPFIVSQISAACVTAFPLLLNTAMQLFGQLWDYVSLELFNTGLTFQKTCGIVTNIFQQIWSVCQTIWATIGQPIWGMITFALDKAKGLFMENMPAILSFFQAAIAGIKDTWENHLKPVYEAIGNFLTDVLKPVFEKVFDGIILPLVKGVFEGIGAYWLEVLKPAFDGICDFLTNIFSGNWKAAWEGITDTFKTVFGGIVNVAKKPINAVIGLVNDMIDAINSVSFDIPDWVPGLGGETFGFDIPNIPMLAKGGVLQKGQVGLLEGSGAEAVVPLEQNTGWINEVASRFNGVSGPEAVEMLRAILAELKQLNSELLDKFIAALEAMHFEIDRREFARLVKEV